MVPRLFIYSQDGLGLGHLRRTSLIAAAYLAARPGSSVLTVCDSPVGQFFATPPGHDYLKLPTVRKERPGAWSPVSLAAPFDEVRAMRAEVIRAAVTGFAPDVLLVDHMPHGAMGELLPTLEAVEHRPVRVVLGLRDILDAPETIRQRWRLEGAFEAVDRFFGSVLVYGSREVYDVAEQYAWPEHLRRRLSYCGYVCSPRPTGPGAQVRERYAAPGEDLVLAMAGGGADGSTLFDTLLRAFPLVRAERPAVLVLVTGPFLPEAEHVRLLRLAEGLPVHVLRAVPDALEHLRAADLVVTMAGYNTTAEILRVGTPALLVPRAGPSAEQCTRASRFAERGWVRWLRPDQLSPATLAQSVVAALATPTPDHAPPTTRLGASPDLGGRERAALRLAGRAA